MTAPEEKPLNALFVMLAAISGVPTVVSGLVLINGGGVISFLSLLWCAAWTYVWWSLRYR
ncbi:hypothetical protein MycrhDRAFT_5792 [Mycolicibacterium rhodesiae JS60]|nr:hypothetical protein MycrhDRAFT_5792 [Mycolicibacterium rhodesiae JS60]